MTKRELLLEKQVLEQVYSMGKIDKEDYERVLADINYKLDIIKEEEEEEKKKSIIANKKILETMR